MSGPQRHNNAKDYANQAVLFLFFFDLSSKNDLGRTHIPDANDDFEVVLQGPLDVLLEVELGAGRQMVLQRSNASNDHRRVSSIKGLANHHRAY
jgi:hypothetical protein